MAVPSHPTARLVELASGVDALYLSGRGDLAPPLLSWLDAERQAAVEADGPVPLPDLGPGWEIEHRSFGRYRYRLSHPNGLVGITDSAHLPSFRVQPRAEFIHGEGCGAVLDFFDDACDLFTHSGVTWGLSRLDLFCDVQGWALTGEDRQRFVCRSASRTLREVQDGLTGIEFGQRSTKTVCARIYDKTVQVEKKGLDWWPMIWGDRFDRSEQVLRVEFEIGRQGLKEFGIDSPHHGLELAPEMWGSVTDKWLSYRSPSSDQTRSRWPVASEWLSVQHASLRGGVVGIDRVRAARRKGELRRLVPSLVGYLAGVGALCATPDLQSTLGAVRLLVERDEHRRGVLFADRVADRAVQEARR